MYTTLQDLTRRYGEDMILHLTDRSDPPAGVIDAQIVDGAIADTAAVIDGYVGAKYALPFGTVPEQIPPLALAIAIYKLHVFDTDAKIKDEYESAIRALREISQGTIRLNAEGVAAEQTGTSGARVTDRPRPMTHDNLRGY